MLRIFTIIFFLICALPVLAKNHVVLIGGGGEPAGKTTIFDYQLPRLGKYIQSSNNQQLNISFNGGHSTTERLLHENFPAARPSSFTSHNYEALISKYEQEIISGKIKSGEKILLMINTHGAEAVNGQLTHDISTASGEARNLRTLEGSQLVSLDRLQRLAQLSEQKGIKLGIIDFSCHSGATLNLGNTRTCVISASGQNSFAYGGNFDSTFASQFTDRMTPGKNLEQVFLEARNSSTDLGFPMISTAEGLRVQNKIYPVLRNYINVHYREEYDKFSPDISNSVREMTCFQEREDLEKLMQLSRFLERINDSIQLQGFRVALRDYSNYRRSVQRELVLAGATIMNEITQVCHRPERCSGYPNHLLLSFDADPEIRDTQNKLRTAPDAETRNSLREHIKYCIQMKAAKQKLLRNHPGMSRYANFFQNYPNIVQRTSELGDRVANESRKLYSGMYSKFRGGPNPCRDFTL